MIKVLLIEDDTAISSMYEMAFRLEKYDITVANNGQEGLVKASDQPFDIILLDVMMPHMNGFDVLKVLKNTELTKNIPVIMLTNLASENAGAALDDGALQYIMKSEHDPKDIVKIVADALSKGHRASANAESHKTK